MEDLIKAIHTTPIIDNHAHPLLIWPAKSTHSFLSITTEAHGSAMRTAQSTLSHIRAVHQLSAILGCPPTWDEVVKAIDVERAKPHHVWEKRCLEGVETILIDDGLDGKSEVHEFTWHDKLTRSECKRIVRIEKIAEEIIDALLKQPDVSPEEIFDALIEAFELMINDAIQDEDIVGFKSVICYRTGLNIPPHLSTADVRDDFEEHIARLQEESVTHFKRLDNQPLNAYLVHKTASIIAKSQSPRMPIQFHTGLGDNDITLTTSSPSHLQELIREYPTVPIVLLHASYPWTKEAGYLASVYDNVYADIGEVFPFLSKDGQIQVVREILELCPTEKILWSTDGHWFPETYLLAIIQMREALEVVLVEYVKDKVLTIPQAIRAVEDILFTTSNDLYALNLRLTPLPSPTHLAIKAPSEPPHQMSDLELLNTFVAKNPTTKFLRLQYLDYTATPRLRVIPIRRILPVLQKSGFFNIGITKASLGLLQNDTIIPAVTATGEYKLSPIFTSIKPGPSSGYASVQSEFREASGAEVLLCPRTILRQQLQVAKSRNLEFLIGFEIEIVFLSRLSPETGTATLSNLEGHAWSSARALHDNKILKILDEIYDTLALADIYLEQIHPESATGQYEFVLPALPPLEAVDAVLQAREIISTVAAAHSLRATLYPKPFANMAGTAAHVHISISTPGGEEKEVYEPFYAGILKHLPAILAFTYSNPASYERMADGCWAGGRWVAWGTQNRETALRKIEGSHFEIKALDGLANVYLALGAIIAAGTKGVVDKEKLIWGDCATDPAVLTDEEREKLGVKEMLPLDLGKALERLEGDEELGGLLGKDVVTRYVAVKKAEIELLGGMSVSDRKAWIIERY